MKKNTFSKATLWASLSLLVACGNPPKETLSKTEEKGLDISAMDTSVRPQDDFYNYVNGSWMKTAKIPADKTSWGTYYMLDDITETNCLSILDDLVSKQYPDGSEGQKIQTLYKQYIDWDTRNKQGLSPIGWAPWSRISTYLNCSKTLVWVRIRSLSLNCACTKTMISLSTPTTYLCSRTT